MKKKDMLIQNQSLFAEVERKTIEIEGLNLKIEELNEKIEKLTAENEGLKKSLDEMAAKNTELEEVNSTLEASLLEKIKPYNITAAETDKDNTPTEVFEETEVGQEETEIRQEEPQPETELPTPQPEIKNSAPTYTPATDELRNYGAEVIGKVTRVTASVLNKIEQIGGDAAPSLNTLALGKNESIKFAVLSLAQSGREPNEIKAEMDRLAEEAIAYLQSI